MKNKKYCPNCKTILTKDLICNHCGLVFDFVTPFKEETFFNSEFIGVAYSKDNEMFCINGIDLFLIDFIKFEIKENEFTLTCNNTNISINYDDIVSCTHKVDKIILKTKKLNIYINTKIKTLDIY